MEKLTYPIQFTPILKEKIWGGQKLKNILNKKSKQPNIGESWEISDVPGDTSVICNGELKGKTLKQLQTKYKADLVGKKNYQKFKNKFPLLIKFIDANQALSIQLHPDDLLAQKRHQSFGKTEMWYVMQADVAANLIVGFNQPMDKNKYLKHLAAKSLPKILNFETVQEGDTFFIEAGLIHAIGAGVLLAEIQQTSDVTYRVYDWDRTDNQGNARELHNDLALDAYNFTNNNNFQVNYHKQQNQSNNMVTCPYFTTNYLAINKPITRKNNFDSFIIYMCVSGEATISTTKNAVVFKTGETVLMPACLSEFQISAKNAKLLEVYV